MKPIICLFLGHTTNNITRMYHALKKEIGNFTFMVCDRCGEEHTLRTFVQVKELQHNLKPKV